MPPPARRGSRLTRAPSARAPPAATEADWTALSVLFDKSLVKAARLVDEGVVRQIVGEESGRSLWRVGRRASSGGGGAGGSRESYVCLNNFCSCQSFYYDVIGKETSLRCKHQIAVDLARALGRYSVLRLPDAALAEILASDV